MRIDLQVHRQERDSETELDYFGARDYSGNMGRFMQADPLYID